MTTCFEDDFVHGTELRISSEIKLYEKEVGRSYCIDDVDVLMQRLNIATPEPHGGNIGEIDDELSRFRALLDRNIPDDCKVFFKMMEVMISSFYIVSKTDDLGVWASTLILVYHSVKNDDETALSQFSQVIKQIYDKVHSPEKGVAEPQSGEDKFSFLRAWKAKIHHPLFEHISHIISLLVTAGLIGTFTWTVRGFDLFKAQAFDKHLGLPDIIDGILSTVLFFCEKGYACFKTCSLKPLWQASGDLNEFDDDYQLLLNKIGPLKLGNLTPAEESDFEIRLEKCREEVKQYLRTAPSNVMRSLFATKQYRIETIYCEFYNHIYASGMREAPFCFCLFGKSAVGKTTLNSTLTAAILDYNNFPKQDKYQCTLQSDDKFFSTYKSSCVALTLDDLCNTKADKAEVSPTARIISIINNCMVYAPKAIAEEKGKVWIRPKLVSITTNSDNLDADFYSIEPVSILRRLNMRITVEAVEAYSDNGKLNKEHVRNRYPNNNDIVKDIWRLTIQKVLSNNDDKSTHENYTWRTVTHKGKLLENVSIHEALPYILSASKLHYQNQREILEEFKEYGDKIQICRKCLQFSQMCVCTGKNGSRKCFTSDNMCELKIVEVEVETPEVIKRKEEELAAFQAALEKARVEEDSYGWLRPPPRIKGFFTKKETPKPMEAHSGFISWVVYPAFKGCSNWIASHIATQVSDTLTQMLTDIFPSPKEYSILDTMSDVVLYSYAIRLNRSPFLWWTRLVPDSMVQTSHFQWFYRWSSRHNIVKDVKIGFIGNAIIGSTFYGGLIASYYALAPLLYKDKCIVPHYGALVLGIPIILAYSYGAALKRAYAITEEELANRVNTTDLYESLTNIHSDAGKIAKSMLIFSAGIALLTTIHTAWKILSPPMSTSHSGLDPKNDEEVNINNTKLDPWKHEAQSLPIVGIDTLCSTPSQLMQTISNNLMYISFSPTLSGTRHFCNALFIESGIMLVPKHIWYPDNNPNATPYESLNIIMIRSEKRGTGGHSTNTWVYFQAGVNVQNEDLMLMHVPFGGTFSSLLNVLPHDSSAIKSTVDILGMSRTVEGNIINFHGNFKPRDMSYLDKHRNRITVNGGQMTYSVKTFCGMCISPIISNLKGPLLIGLHIAGLTHTVDGAAVTLTRTMYLKAREYLQLVPGYFSAHASGTLQTSVLGKSIGYAKRADLRSPIQFVESYQAKLYGVCDGGAKYNTKIAPSIFSERLESKWGIENLWSGPKFCPDGQRWRPWYASLVHMVNPNHGLDPRLLQLAKVDYMLPLLPKLKMASVNKYLRPLTMEENINGINGARFIDGLNLKTSIGFPLSGAKSKYIQDMEARDDHGLYVRQFKDTLHLEAEVSRCEQLYMQGERCHHIFKACLKDEAVKKTKDKVRVFQAAPITLQLLMRKYYLPLLKFVSTFPLLSECAVGINCYGPDWDELHKHVTQFGDDRIFAGDYAKYDLKMPCHVVLLAFDVLIQFAKESGNYKEEELTIMRGIATDVAYPTLAYNGTLIELFGTMPSGHNATAHLNSIGNSILIRTVFFSLENKNVFRKHVAIMTYGDDIIGGVSKELGVFNHISVANKFLENNIVFTMPDKTSTPTPFMTIKDVDFLKRNSVYLGDIKKYVGALDINSINKSLCVYRKNDVLKPPAIMQSIVQSALHELVLHGRTTYDKYVEILRDVSENAQVLIPALNMTYNERIAMWYLNYNPEVPDCELPNFEVAGFLRKFKEEKVAPVVGSMLDNVTLDDLLFEQL